MKRWIYGGIKYIGFAAALCALTACATSPQDASQLRTRAVIDTDYGNGFPPDTSQLIKRVAATATPIVGDSAVLCPSTLTVTQDSGRRYDICSTQFVVLISPVVNAHLNLRPRPQHPLSVFTRGGELSITSSLIRLLTQDELAFVISHELAHHIAQHNLDRGPGPHMELEADRIAIFLMARSGYDPQAALAMLSKVMKDSPLRPATHPDFNERVSNIQDARAEVARLQSLGQPLIP